MQCFCYQSHSFSHDSLLTFCLHVSLHKYCKLSMSSKQWGIQILNLVNTGIGSVLGIVRYPKNEVSESISRVKKPDRCISSLAKAKQISIKIWQRFCLPMFIWLSVYCIRTLLPDPSHHQYKMRIVWNTHCYIAVYCLNVSECSWCLPGRLFWHLFAPAL